MRGELLHAHMLKAALFGYPLAHSVSPHMHRAAAKAMDIYLDYALVDVTPAKLTQAVECLRQTDYVGANVTMPHKPAMLHLVDAATPLARRVGAINTVYKSNQMLVGDNTDAPAFMQALRLTLAYAPRQEAVLLLGAGGAARAAAMALIDSDVRSLTLWNRTPDRAHELMASMQSHDVDGTLLEVVTDHETFQVACRAATLVVNATSAGVFDSTLPLDFSMLNASCRVFDMLYGHDGTTFVHDARSAGLQAEDGLWMLVFQAALSFQRWTGREPDRQIMHGAAVAALASRAMATQGSSQSQRLELDP